jgi:methylenetetrahydrofolate dehydrogenase (NADP+)/methenyltetrahydrofolate cyclohydrolase
MSHLIDGKAIAKELNAETAAQVASLRDGGIRPALAVVLSASDESAAWYVRSIQRAAAARNIECQVHELAGSDTGAITSRLAALSADPAVHGIICQTPLPAGTDLATVGASIAVGKDVDGANPTSLGMLAAGVPGAFAPATAAAVMTILRHEIIPLGGRRAVVVGRSTVVGKPVALLLLAEHATVTISHSRTPDLASVCREADVLVVAVGRPHLIGARHVRRGAVVIDVGTNPTEDGLTGDVDTNEVAGVSAAVTPVPGGVGPVTTALLLRQTVQAAVLARGARAPGL